jgi:ABC-type branched-subunit amino acid transport system substrate-binding protein
MTTKHVLELAICTVTDKEAALAARRQAMQAVSRYPGFVSWRAATACETADMLADLVEWETLEAARAAGKRVMTDPEFAPYMAAISSVQLMQHFLTEQRI